MTQTVTQLVTQGVPWHPKRMADAPNRYLAALQGLRDGLTTREAAAHAGITRTALTTRRGADEGYQTAWTAALSEGQAKKSRRRAREARRRTPITSLPPTLEAEPDEPPGQIIELQLVADADHDIADATPPGVEPSTYGETLAQFRELAADINTPPQVRAKALDWVGKVVFAPVIAEQFRLAKAAPVDGSAPERVRYELPASPMRQDD